MKIILTVIIIILSSTNITSIITINKYKEIVNDYVRIVKIYKGVVDSYSTSVDTAISIIKEYEKTVDWDFKAGSCFAIYLSDGWEDIFDTDSICDEIIEVRMTVGDKTIDYTAEEFLDRLGFD